MVADRSMHPARQASPNGRMQNILSATSPGASHSKSVKLVLRPTKVTTKAQSDALPGTPLEVLFQELPPRDFDDQVPLEAIIDRLVQDAYARLVELSDTLPGSALQSRAREVDHYAVETRKQFIKAYVLSKWAKVAEDVETSMAITQYLVGHNNQLDQAVAALVAIKNSLANARLRNPDVATAITVLTQPPEFQTTLLPTIIREAFTAEKSLTAGQVKTTLLEMNDVLRLRLRMWEIVPLEWSDYRIDNGRVYFTATSLFTASFSLTGREPHDTWYFVDMAFLFGVGGPSQDRISAVFPRKPPPHLWAQILPGVNAQLSMHAQLSRPEPLVDGSAATGDNPHESKESLQAGIVDAPLVRAFNLLQMLSLTYQLEILLHQANQLRSLGWADYLKIEVSGDRRRVNIRYWVRTAPYYPLRTSSAPPSPPMHGGTIVIAILPGASSHQSASSVRGSAHPPNLHVDKFARDLEQRCTLEAVRRVAAKKDLTVPTLETSDHVENVALTIKWEPEPLALAIQLPAGSFDSESETVAIDPSNSDCEALIKGSIQRHARTILRHFQTRIQTDAWRRYIADREGVVLIDDNDSPTLRLTLFKDQMLYISIDSRTGRFILRDSGDLAAWERGYRFAPYADGLNNNPAVLLDAVFRLRFNTILEAIEHQVTYIGLQSYRLPGFSRSELAKFGPGAPGYLFINLASFPSHYIVIIVTEDGFKYALINTSREVADQRSRLVIADLGWLDPEKLGLGPIPNDFTVRADVLREMYAFGCARVSHTRVEQQLKSRGIPYNSIFPKTLAATTSSVQRNRAVPVLRVLARDLWPPPNDCASQSAMGNIKISLMNWWNVKRSRVVTEVKLKSPPPLSLSRHRSSAVSGPGLNPNSLVSYDPTSSVVSFVSGDAESSVDEFLAEWDRVQKTLAIARHVAKMSRQKGYEDVKLLSFNLLAIEFLYHSEFVVVVEYIPPVLMLQPGMTPAGTFRASFSRLASGSSEGNSHRMDVDGDADPTYNPHQEIASHLSPRIIEGNEELTRQAVQEFIVLLRATLPILQELDSIKRDAAMARVKHPSFPSILVLYKGAAWFRIFYNLTYALDIRMLSEGQVAVLDGSFSFFNATKSSTPSSSSASPSSSTSGPNSSLLQPIPRLRDLAESVIDDLAKDKVLRAKLFGPGKPTPVIFSVGNGFRCSNVLAGVAARRLHESVLEVIKDNHIII